jgi:two-component sensor histidine kinase
MAENGRDKSTSERLRQQRASLADFGLQAFRGSDLDELLSCAVRLVSDAVDIKLVKILELLPGGDRLLVRAGVNWNPGVVGHATIGADINSPAGFALRTSEPVISHDTGRENRFRIPQVLREHHVRSMVNVLIPGEAKPFGVLEVDATEIFDFKQDDVDFLRNYAHLIAAAIDRIETQNRLKTIADERDLLLREVQHRVKNMLMVVDTLASQTASEGRSADEFKEIFLGRLRAFGRAEQIIFDEEGGTLDMRNLLELIVKAYLVPGRERIRLDGPDVILGREQATALGLVIHELATNASKYGALSRDEGGVTIRWGIEGKEAVHVKMAWIESGGPPVDPPSRKGFGTRLISQAATVQLKGSAAFLYETGGLRCKLDFPLRGEG